jgi:predicted nucleotidyltransferase
LFFVLRLAVQILLFCLLLKEAMSNTFTIEEIKNKVSDTARQYGVKKVYLFGSYARGEACPGSDIDICIEKGNIQTLFELSGFFQDLEETLGNKIDLVTTAGLSGEFKEQIEKDMVVIYG